MIIKISEKWKQIASIFQIYSFLRYGVTISIFHYTLEACNNKKKVKGIFFKFLGGLLPSRHASKHLLSWRNEEKRRTKTLPKTQLKIRTKGSAPYYSSQVEDPGLCVSIFNTFLPGELHMGPGLLRQPLHPFFSLVSSTWAQAYIPWQLSH